MNKDDKNTTRHLGNFSAVEPAYSRLMYCYDCNVDWVGCWDNFQCPECGQGELPNSDINFDLFDFKRPKP